MKLGLTGVFFVFLPPSSLQDVYAVGDILRFDTGPSAESREPLVLAGRVACFQG